MSAGVYSVSINVSAQIFPYAGVVLDEDEINREVGSAMALHRTAIIKENEQPKVTLEAIKKAAHSYGLQIGLYHRNQSLIKLMNSLDQHMSQIFNFNKFLIDGKVLCPTVMQGERIFDQVSETEVRVVTMSYTLDKNARIVPAPPTWRDYLIRAIDKPRKPNPVLWPDPQDSAEVKVWQDSILSGVEAGKRQADTVFKIDLRKLQAEIEGMYLFRKLAAQNIVTLPTLGKSGVSVVRSADGRTLNVKDVVYRIVSDSDFSKTEEWEPFFRQGRATQ